MPHVLIVDDDLALQQHSAAALRKQGLNVEVRTPDRVSPGDLLAAHVVAVDHYYKWDRIPHPTEIAFWPHDGLAMAAVLTGQMRKLNTHAAVVLRTGELPKLAQGLPTNARVPLLAAQNSLDWILTKGDEREGDKILGLAAAVHDLAALVESPSSWNDGVAWLKLPDSEWAESALVDVEVCRPPEHAVAVYTGGSAWIRWFAHRILPFPTFLFSDFRAAHLLRLSVDDFRQMVEDSLLAPQLSNCQYRGHLSDLVERRWWRAGLDAIVDNFLASADPELNEAEALAKCYSEAAGRKVEVLREIQPVITVDADYVDESIEEASHCVRLAPDLWPVFAEEAWALIDDVAEDSELTAMVSRGDRERLRKTDK